MSLTSQPQNVLKNFSFGNIFTKNGKGKKKFGGKNVTNFLKKILGNRVFDLYLKYLGITSLTTATLVPFGLVLSAEYADKIIKNKPLGKLNKTRIPILDNSLVGNYLKIAGLSLLELTPVTLLPLGVIMIIYELAIKNLIKQTGGRLTVGSSIPPNFVQKIDAIVSGQTGAGLFEAYDLLDPKLQQECGAGACLPNNISKSHDFRIKGMKVKGFKNNKVPQADSIHEIKHVKNHEANIDPTYKGNDKGLHLMAGGGISGVKQVLKDFSFGNILTKTGKGKKKFGGKNVTNFLKKILGNRVFDLYLKYLGITSLTTATLVPFGLVLSAEYADKIIKNKPLGKLNKTRIPILDNSLVGNYLKIAGLSLLELTPVTLLPLGVIMIIYELAIKNLIKQTGGRLTVGSSIPPNFVQKIDAIVSGQTGAGLFEAYDLLDPKLQQECGAGACLPNNISKSHDLGIKGTKVKGFKNNKVPQADSINEINAVKNHQVNIDPSYKGNDKGLHLMAGGSVSGGKNVYNKIVNPKTGRAVNINGALGKSIVKNYLNFLRGGSVVQDAMFSLSQQEASQALNLCDQKLSKFYKK